MHDLRALQRVLEYLSQAGAPTPEKDGWPDEKERRGGRRFLYGAEGTGTLTQREGGLPAKVAPDFPVIALNLSRSGTGFLCNYELQTDDVVLLEMPSTDGLQKQLHIRVVHCKRTGLNAFQVGARFISPDEQDEKQS